MLVLTPIFGTMLFVMLYIIATLLYPGGSQVDKASVGFSWINNYWCNLLNENAINGQPNPAKPVAMTGMLILCLTLIFFWFLFPKHINLSKNLRLVIQISGTLAMIISVLFVYEYQPRLDYQPCLRIRTYCDSWRLCWALQSKVGGSFLRLGF